MKKETSEFKSRIPEFNEWLILEKGLSKRVSGDIISRCKRIEKYISPDLHDAVSTEDNFQELIGNIVSYSRSMLVDAHKASNLKKSLVHAAKHYALFSFNENAQKYAKTIRVKWDGNPPEK